MAWLGRLRAPRIALTAEQVERQELSAAELRAGRLPLAAQERLAEQTADQVFTSDLSTADLVALRAAGYEPVGQAFGTATYGLSRSMQQFTRYSIHPSGGYGGVPGYGGYRGYGPSLSGDPKLVQGYHAGVNTARSAALRRLMAECTGLGADGVLGVRIVRSAPTSGLVEVTLVGTAVRRAAPTGPPAPVPFSTTLGAVDVGVLRSGGWGPVQMLYEFQRYAAHAGYLGIGRGRMNPLSYSSGEITAASTAITYAGTRTRSRLLAHLPAGGGMILDAYDADLGREECVAVEGYTDFVVDVEAIGTAIEPVPSMQVRRSPAPLVMTPVLRLTGP